MAQFLKFKFLITLKLNFTVGQFYIENIKFWLFQKVEKNHNKSGKYAVENFGHFGWCRLVF